MTRAVLLLDLVVVAHTRHQLCFLAVEAALGAVALGTLLPYGKIGEREKKKRSLLKFACGF
jgi:hypothetical protein